MSSTKSNENGAALSAGKGSRKERERVVFLRAIHEGGFLAYLEEKYDLKGGDVYERECWEKEVKEMVRIAKSGEQVNLARGVGYGDLGEGERRRLEAGEVEGLREELEARR